MIEKHFSKLGEDFHLNKKVLSEFGEIPSKRLRNKIAGTGTIENIDEEIGLKQELLNMLDPRAQKSELRRYEKELNSLKRKRKGLEEMQKKLNEMNNVNNSNLTFNYKNSGKLVESKMNVGEKRDLERLKTIVNGKGNKSHAEKIVLYINFADELIKSVEKETGSKLGQIVRKIGSSRQLLYK